MNLSSTRSVREELSLRSEGRRCTCGVSGFAFAARQQPFREWPIAYGRWGRAAKDGAPGLHGPGESGFVETLPVKAATFRHALNFPLV
jgi:hypothetical protein